MPKGAEGSGIGWVEGANGPVGVALGDEGKLLVMMSA